MRVATYAAIESEDRPVPMRLASLRAQVNGHAGSVQHSPSALTVLSSVIFTARARTTFNFRGSKLGPHALLPTLAAVLADANARLGADVNYYPFIIEDFHLILPAGRPRTNIFRLPSVWVATAACCCRASLLDTSCGRHSHPNHPRAHQREIASASNCKITDAWSGGARATARSPGFNFSQTLRPFHTISAKYSRRFLVSQMPSGRIPDPD
jgi:hypothetical protein